MLRVMRKHRDAVKKIESAHVPLDLLQAAKRSWDEVVELGDEHGLRNSQISVLAPTGTIAFMMDCDTTGVEPDIALVKYRKLVGGGMIKIVNNTVPKALARLGYDKDEVRAIVEFVDENDTIEGAPQLAGRAPAGLRLRLQAGQRLALDPLHGARQDAGGGAAVHLRGDLEDRQPARGVDARTT